MRNYVVTFTCADGQSYTHDVTSMSAVLAVRVAHQRATEEVPLREIVEITCKVDQ